MFIYLCIYYINICTPFFAQVSCDNGKYRVLLKDKDVAGTILAVTLL